jgi:hypothetical protein
MRPQEWSNERAREGGVIVSIIANVDGAAAKTMMTGVVAIGWKAIAVVSMRGTVAGCGLITSSAGKGPATAKDALCLHLSIIDDDNNCCSHHEFPPLCHIGCHPRPRTLVADVDVVATVQDDVPPSKIVVPVANAKDGEEGGERRVEGGWHCNCSWEEQVTSPYNDVFCDLIVGEIRIVAAAAAQELLLQLPWQPQQLRSLTGAG